MIVSSATAVLFLGEGSACRRSQNCGAVPEVKILLTGANGFIAFYLLSALLTAGQVP